MNIPIDRLYQYIENIAQEIFGDHALIYRFWPHGSKNIQDLNPLRPSEIWWQNSISPVIYCNDQEPLCYDYYTRHIRHQSWPWPELVKKIGARRPITNLNWYTNIFSKNILLHSEKNSVDIDKYKAHNELILAYYWSHALIARDWFRFAEHAQFKKNPTKLFLIYNRSWTGTREYRIKFADLLVEHGILEQCKTTFNAQDSDTGLHYKNYEFMNPAMRPHHELENFFQSTTAQATSSADFEIADYESTQIEVVLETLFDDSRWHLTEKTLRPIACGQPFILVGTAGSLKYLKDYGFKTFSDVWSEEYDNIDDAAQRLESIADLMKYLATLDEQQKNTLMKKTQDIATFNKRRFFSREFFDLIVGELKSNLELAFEEFQNLPINQSYLDQWDKILSHDETMDFLRTNQDPGAPTLEIAHRALALVKEGNK